MGKSVLFSGFEPKSLTYTWITNRTMKSVGNPRSASQSTVGARWKILSYRWNLVRSRMCLSKRSVAVDGHQLVRIRSKFSDLSDLTEQNLQDDEVNDYEIVVDFESLEDDDREVGDRFIPSSSCQTLTAKCFLQNGNPERGHDFEQRIAALASDIEKMAPNLKAIEKCVPICAIQVQLELISSCAQADRRGGKVERHGKRQ